MRRLIFPALLLLLGFAAYQPAYALPAFARREGVSCQMCHFRMPEFNEDGRAYLLRGLREIAPSVTAGTAAPAVPAPKVALGMPLDINWANYLTVMGEHSITAARRENLAFSAGGVDVWAAGPIDPHWTGLADIAFDIEEGGVGLDQAYGQYITNWSDRFGSARFGQSLPFAILINQGGPVNMPISSPVVLGAEADTGTGWTPTTPLRMVELGAVDLARGDIYLGAAQPHLDVAPAEPHTDLFLSADYLIGKSNNLISLYGYFGKASLEGGDESFHRIGVFSDLYLTKNLPNSKVVLGYVQGSDDTVDGPTLDDSGYFLLLEHLLSESWAAYARYDHFNRDLLEGGTETTNGPTLGVTWWAQSQIRLTTEAQLQKVTGSEQERTLTVDLLWLF